MGTLRIKKFTRTDKCDFGGGNYCTKLAEYEVFGFDIGPSRLLCHECAVSYCMIYPVEGAEILE